ncbi:MAG: hypothetical protein A2Z18_08560, partial [Armatimonadetes bacterium RBG_16_58_9]
MTEREEKKRWIRLSYDLSEDSPLAPGLPAISREVISSIAEGSPSNTTIVRMCMHVGTHVDAPLHFARGGAAITDFDVNEFCFNNPLILDVPVRDAELVTPEHLEPSSKSIANRDILLVRTGFGKYRSTDPDRYQLHGPGFAESGAKYLAENFPSLRCLGLDTISLVAMRHMDEGVRAHQALLRPDRKFLIIEDMKLDAELTSLEEV